MDNAHLTCLQRGAKGEGNTEVCLKTVAGVGWRMEMMGKVLQTYRTRAGLVPKGKSPSAQWVLAPQLGRGCSKTRLLGCGTEPTHQKSSSAAPGDMILPRPPWPLGSPLRGKHQSCCSLKYQPWAGDSEKEVVRHAAEKPQAEPCWSFGCLSLVARKVWV